MNKFRIIRQCCIYSIKDIISLYIGAENLKIRIFSNEYPKIQA